MDKEEFDGYFATLEKASDRTRSVVYAFIIVYIAVLLYALNAFAYPARQFTYDAVSLEIRCLYHPDEPKCAALKEFVASTKRPPQFDESIEKSLWEHQLGLFYDDSVSVRTFKFPIFGLETDRDLLWVIFPLIGMIAYFIVWLALGRLVSTFRFLIERNRDNAVRLRLIQSTLMITTPLNLESGDFTPFYRALWQLLAFLVFFIPILVSVLTIADQTNAIPVLRGVSGEVFMGNPTPAFLARLAFELVMLLLQVSLFAKLISLGRAFGRDQDLAQRTIGELEAQASGSPT